MKWMVGEQITGRGSEGVGGEEEEEEEGAVGKVGGGGEEDGRCLASFRIGFVDSIAFFFSFFWLLAYLLLASI